MSQTIEKKDLGETIRNIVAKTAKAIEVNENAGRQSFFVKSELTEGLKVNNSIRQFNLISDEPPVLAGTDEGPNPVELVLAALASCQEIVISAYANALGVSFEKIQVDVKGELDLRGFFNLANVRPGFDKITLQTKVITDEKDTEKLKQLEQLAKYNCPVLDIIQNQITVNDSIQFVVE
jgi:putative redox protein